MNQFHGIFLFFYIFHFSAVDTTAGQEVEQEDAPIIVRSRRRRQRPINPAPPMGSIGGGKKSIIKKLVK